MLKIWITAPDTSNPRLVKRCFLIASCDNSVPVKTPRGITEKCFHYCLEIVFLIPDNVTVLIGHEPKWSTDWPCCLGEKNDTTVFPFPSVRVTLAICLDCMSSVFFLPGDILTSFNCHNVMPQQAPTLAVHGHLHVHMHMQESR